MLKAFTPSIIERSLEVSDRFARPSDILLKMRFGATWILDLGIFSLDGPNVCEELSSAPPDTSRRSLLDYASADLVDRFSHRNFPWNENHHPSYDLRVVNTTGLRVIDVAHDAYYLLVPPGNPADESPDEIQSEWWTIRCQIEYRARKLGLMALEEHLYDDLSRDRVNAEARQRIVEYMNGEHGMVGGEFDFTVEHVLNALDGVTAESMPDETAFKWENQVPWDDDDPAYIPNSQIPELHEQFGGIGLSNLNKALRKKGCPVKWMQNPKKGGSGVKSKVHRGDALTFTKQLLPGAKKINLATGDMIDDPAVTERRKSKIRRERDGEC